MSDLLFLDIHVIPGASQTKLVSYIDHVLRVRLASPPVDGEANKELIRTLAKSLGVSKSDVAIVSGHASRRKRVSVAGVTLAKVEAVLRGIS